MGLRIFDQGSTDGAKRKSFADDVVGRFRSGYQVDAGRGKTKPVALTEWRVTTGDPDVAVAVAELLNGDEPQKWGAHGEDDLEVFTKADEVEIILEGDKPLRQRMILWGRNGKVIRESDGETCTDGTPDPDAGKPLAERKQLARDGVGPEPQIEIYFRLAANPELGIFKFQSGSWSLASDLAYNGTEDELTDLLADGEKPLASLSLEKVEFTAKNGPRAGQLVTYTKPVLAIKGAA